MARLRWIAWFSWQQGLVGIIDRTDMTFENHTKKSIEDLITEIIEARKKQGKVLTQEKRIYEK